jgi:hypothetical protein
VTSALRTDVFQVYATTTVSDYPSLEGITFSNEQSEIPEPGTLGMVIGGFPALAGDARRKILHERRRHVDDCV